MIIGIKFTKAQALGNDFVIIDDRAGSVSLTTRDIVEICDRRRGVGADGILLLQPSASAAFMMRTLNADGSEAEMCGNGIRCAAKFAYDTGLVSEPTIDVATKAGLKKVDILEATAGRAVTIRVDLGEPDFGARQAALEPLTIGGETVNVIALSMGNPHAVTFVPDVAAADVAAQGPAIATHAAFPRQTNVEFAEVDTRNHIRLRVWERGAGETDACGTGAAAAVAAAHRTGLTDRSVRVALPGGELAVEWADDGHVFITGGAELVFTGTTGAAS